MTRDPLDDFIVAGARAFDLKIDEAWMPAVRGHLQVTLRHGALVAAFALARRGGIAIVRSYRRQSAPLRKPSCTPGSP